MTYRSILREHRQQRREIFVLVSWPEEDDTVSVISSLRASEPLVVGKLCEVTEKKAKYPARVHATGTKQELNKLMKDYLQGKSSLFGLILPTDTTTPPTETTTLPPPPTEATTLPPPPTETTTLPPPPPPTETTTLPPPPTLASTELPPKKKKQKICGKENVSNNGRQQKTNKALQRKKGQTILLVTPHGVVRPTTPVALSHSLLPPSVTCNLPSQPPSHTHSLSQPPSPICSPSPTPSPILPPIRSLSPTPSPLPPPIRSPSPTPSSIRSPSPTPSPLPPPIRYPSQPLPQSHSPLLFKSPSPTHLPSRPSVVVTRFSPKNLASQFSCQGLHQELQVRMSKIEDTQLRILQALGRIESRFSPYHQFSPAGYPPSTPTFSIHHPSLNATPTVQYPSLNATPTVQYPSLNSTPTAHHPSLNATPTAHHPSLNATPTAHHPSLNATPTGHHPSLDPTLTLQSPTHSEPLPLNHQYFGDPLPSSEIDVRTLVSIEEALENIMCPNKTDSRKKELVPSTVAQTLAKLAIFGVDVMKRCTPSGSSILPALPTDEMYKLKKVVFHTFPSFWHSPLAFDIEWKSKCWPAIEQACRRLRRTHGKTTKTTTA